MLANATRTMRQVSPIHHAAAAAVMSCILFAWHEVYFAYLEPPFWIVVLVLAGCVGLIRFAPSGLWTWWAAGAVTLAWSLAPGNTFVATLWETGLVAAFAAGFWRRGFWITSVVLLLLGLERTLVLSSFGIAQLVSGSIHYVAGAQAIVLVPLSLSVLVRPGKRHARIACGVLLLLSVYLALMSGSRAVYLPLAGVLLILGIRHLVERRNITLVVGTYVLLMGGVVSLDAMIPVHPVAAALGSGVSAEAQARAVSESGPFAQRLRFWDQTLDIALAHPLGAGTGSYQAVIHNYQKYPMAWSASPHNYYVETVATGGWVRLALLLALLLIPVWRAWRSQQWPWALATAGIWTTLAFDVTSYYPIFMMFAFLTLGATHFATLRSGTRVDLQDRTWRVGRTRPAAALALLCVGVAVGLMSWWYFPCKSDSCVVDRYFGYEEKSVAQLQVLDAESREKLLAKLRVLYPESIWVLRAAQVHAVSPVDKLTLAREIASRFPYQHPENFLAWAEAALEVGDLSEARTAVESGLEIFPEGSYPYGERRMTPERYQAWIQDANAILARSSQ